MADETQLEMLMRIRAEGSQAKAEIRDVAATVQAANRTVAEGLRKQGIAASEAAQVYKQLGFSAAKSGEEITAAYGEEVPAAMAQATRSANTFRSAISNQLSDLLVLRRAMYASFGLVSFGYIISEWGRVADAIKQASMAVGGFGDVAQKAFQADIKASDDALTHFQGLTTQIKIATGQFLIAQSGQFENAAIAARDAAQKNLDYMTALLGPLGKTMDPLDLYRRQEAGDQAAHWNQVRIAQLEELGKLEKQWQQEQKKGAHTEETGAHQRAAALAQEQRAIRAMIETENEWAARAFEVTQRNAQNAIRWLHQAEAEAQRLKDSQSQFSFEAELHEGVQQTAGEKDLTARAVAVGMAHWKALLQQSKTVQQQIAEQNRKALESYQQFGQGVRNAFDMVNQDLEMMGARHLRVYGEIGSILQRSISTEQRAAEASGAAAMSKTAFTIGALKQLAPVKAAVQLAEALGDLGDLNFWGAAQHFASAAMWGVVGASQVMGMVGGAGGGGGGRGGGGSRGGGGGGRSHGPAQETAGYSTPQGPGGQNTGPMLHITMIGEQEAGAWIAQTLTSGVQGGRFQLTASGSMSTPVPRA